MLIGATAYALGMLAVPMSEAPELEDYRCHEIKALVRRGISAADAAEYIPEAAGCPSGLIEQLKTLARGQAATGKRDGVTLVVATLPRRPPRVQTDPSSLRGASHGHEGRPTVTPPNQSPTRPAPELVQSHAPPPPPPPPRFATDLPASVAATAPSTSST